MFAENETLGLEVKDLLRNKLGKLIIFEDVEQNDTMAMVVNQPDQQQKMIID